MRHDYLTFAKPEIEDNEILAVLSLIGAGGSARSARVSQFETMFAAIIGVRHAVAVNSPTAALYLALSVIGIGPGDEVLVPALSSPDIAAVVHYTGATPLPVDCEMSTLSLDPARLEQAITPRTKAIIALDIAGQAGDLDAINAVAARHHLALVQDAGHALLATYQGRRIGSISPLTIFRFYNAKTLTVCESGVVVTNDAEYARRLRRAVGQGSDDTGRRYYANAESWPRDSASTGRRYDLTTAAAMMGEMQLCKAASIQTRRSQIAARYSAAFAHYPGLGIPYQAADRDHSWQLYILQLEIDQLSCTRDQFLRELKARNIGANVPFILLHRQPYYMQNYSYTLPDLPMAERAHARMLALPIYPSMSDNDVEDVIEAVGDLVAKHRR